MYRILGAELVKQKIEEETMNFILTVITFGIILLSIVAIVLIYLGLVSSHSLDEIIIGC